MKVNQLNLGFLIILTFITITAILIVINYYFKLKKVLDRAKDAINHIIPRLTHSQYVNIVYPDWNTHFTHDRYTPELASFMGTLLLSAYNASGGYDPRWAKHMKAHARIGKTGFVIKMHDNTWLFIFRGTMNKEDIVLDFEFSQSPFLGSTAKKQLLVHTGFNEQWQASLNDFEAVKEQIGKDATIYLAGHSMGCGGAAFAAVALSEVVDQANLVLYLFAPPRIGNRQFMKELTEKVPNQYALINRQDIIPCVPPNNCATLSHTYLYDNFSKVVYLDLQTNSMIDNHQINSYLYAIDPKVKANKPASVLWCDEPKLLVSL